MNDPDLHALSGAYAAHALRPEERPAFEEHLAGCEVCAREVDGFAATLARLAACEASAVPPGAEERAMAAIGTVRQLPPAGAAAPSGTARRRLAHPRRWTGLAPAACLAAAAVLGGVAVQQHDEARQSRAEAGRLHTELDRFSALLTAPDARTATTTAADGEGTGTAVWSESRNQAGFLTTGLPPLPSGTTYELWFADGGAFRPAGLMASAQGARLLEGPLGQATGIGVTLEPAGGSPQPTSDPVLLVPVS
ncbi:hypothetical protein KNE206_65170 [Kitasatospora sp. NE20-6]|uniref:anti-sigma factor n=1 Tax=Kitasatospora sp. NE20-6 TaxID=2859066 RepID=UPI0034DBE001